MRGGSRKKSTSVEGGAQHFQTPQVADRRSPGSECGRHTFVWFVHEYGITVALSSRLQWGNGKGLGCENAHVELMVDYGLL